MESAELLQLLQYLKEIKQNLNGRKKYRGCYNVLLISAIFGVGLALIIGASVDYEDDQNISKFGRSMMIAFGFSICFPYICVFVYATARGCYHYNSFFRYFADSINDIFD